MLAKQMAGHGAKQGEDQSENQTDGVNRHKFSISCVCD
jgi:hypothetical protein